MQRKIICVYNWQTTGCVYMATKEQSFDGLVTALVIIAKYVIFGRQKQLGCKNVM